MTPPPPRVDVAAVVRRAAVVLAVVAFAGSWWHVMTFAADEGQAWPLAVVIATMPEVSVAVCILRLRSGPSRWQGVWAGVVLATSVAFTIRANLGMQVPTDANAVMVAVWPAWAAIGAAGLVEQPRHRPATRAATRAATVAEPAATAAATAAEPAASPPATAAGFPTGKAAEQAAWFHAALRAHPDRTDEDWSTVTGLSVRTVQRRIEAAGGRPRGPALAVVGGAS